MTLTNRAKYVPIGATSVRATQAHTLAPTHYQGAQASNAQVDATGNAMAHRPGNSVPTAAKQVRATQAPTRGSADPKHTSSARTSAAITGVERKNTNRNRSR